MAKNCDSFDIPFYINLEKTNQAFSPIPFSDGDFKRTHQVALDVCSYAKRYELRKEKVDLNVLLSKALYEMDSIGCITNINETISILNRLDYCYDDNESSLFATLSEVVGTKTGVAKKAMYIIVPEMITSTSHIFMSHEISHVLKERNHEECKNVYTLQETIPMLIELIMAFLSNDSYTFRNLLDERMNLLALEARNYFKVKKEMQKAVGVNFQALHTAMLLSSVYLNSFFYSLVLFQVYLTYPSFIKEMITSVLNLEMTTQEMIKVVFDEYDDISLYESYQDGIKMVKSSL